MNSDPLSAFTKTHRVFVWTIMYLAEKPQVIEALRREYADVSSEGNRCMHRIIAFLEGSEQDHASTSDLYKSSSIMQAHWDICLEYLRETLKNWLDTGRLC